MTIAIIAAISINNTIGLNNKIIWNINKDKQFFKTITMGHTIVMGRKTYESILCKPLNNRTNIILTRNMNYVAQKCIIFNDIQSMLCFVKKYQKIFIIGGGEIYQQTINIADTLYITHINNYYKGDTFFPIIDKKKWSLQYIYYKNSYYSFVKYSKIII